MGHWNLLLAHAMEARRSDDPAIREAGRQLQAMMVRMWYDDKAEYLINFRELTDVEKGAGYRGGITSPYPGSTAGYLAFDVSVDKEGYDPVRSIAHELGGAEAVRHQGSHDEGSIQAEDDYRTVRKCELRRTHENVNAETRQ